MQSEHEGGDGSVVKKTIYAISILIFFIAFIGFWIYCISEYGFLVGVTLGWIPSAIAALFVAFLWPIAIVLLIIIVAVVLLIDYLP